MAASLPFWHAQPKYILTAGFECPLSSLARSPTALYAGMAPSLLDVAIVGGGPGGLAAAKGMLTARPDLRVGVFERSCSITAPRGASLGLLPNGIRALEVRGPRSSA